MKLEHSFTVGAPREVAWEFMMDVPRVIPCMPGADLVETRDESSWKVNMHVKLGPVALTFASDVTREVREEASSVMLRADARELRGRDTARASIASTLVSAVEGTRVDIVAELAMAGAMAQYGRGVMEGIASQLVGEFGECVERRLSEEGEPSRSDLTERATPVPGFALAVRALLRILAKRLRLDSVLRR